MRNLELSEENQARRNPDSVELPEFYVHSDASLVYPALRTLKHGNAFAVLNEFGDIRADPAGPGGLYYRDTRFLSWFEVRFEGKPLLF